MENFMRFLCFCPVGWERIINATVYRSLIFYYRNTNTMMFMIFSSTSNIMIVCSKTNECSFTVWQYETC